MCRSGNSCSTHSLAPALHVALTFDVRENPASDRRHGSRFAVGAKSSSHLMEKENAEALASSTFGQRAYADAQPPGYAATNQAATVGKRGDDSRLLTIRDVAELLQVPVSWVYEHTRRTCIDRMPGFRLGKYWRFSEADIRAWLRSKTQE